jgi:hypothetical protein
MLQFFGQQTWIDHERGTAPHVPLYQFNGISVPNGNVIESLQPPDAFRG